MKRGRSEKKLEASFLALLPFALCPEPETRKQSMEEDEQVMKRERSE